MSTRSLLPAAAVAVAACLVLIFTQDQIGASERPPSLLWGDSAMGTPLPWPAGFDTACIAALPRYSPSGRYLAFQTNLGAPFVLDLAEGALTGVYDVATPDRPNLQCCQIAWLTDEHLFLSERWMAEEDRAYWNDENNPFDRTRLGTARHRVLAWPGGATILERTALVSGRAVDAAGFEGGDRWIGRDWSEPNPERRFWLFDPFSDSLLGLAAECTEAESLRWPPCGPWFVKVLAPRSVNPAVHAVDLLLLNYRTKETRCVPDVPAFHTCWGPLVTADGRYVLTASWKADRPAWAPTVFDTETGGRRELPASESWVPGTINESRGVVLAVVLRHHPDGGWTTDYLEIPFGVLFAE
jgi:hypothetical protein